MITPPAKPNNLADMAHIAPYLRAAFARSSAISEKKHWIFDLRTDPKSLAFSSGLGTSDIAQRGVATPDHVIRMKGRPVVLDAPDLNNLGDWAAQTQTKSRRLLSAISTIFIVIMPGLRGGKIALDAYQEPLSFRISGWWGRAELQRTRQSTPISSSHGWMS